jgi:hypothetical protein
LRIELIPDAAPHAPHPGIMRLTLCSAERTEAISAVKQKKAANISINNFFIFFMLFLLWLLIRLVGWAACCPPCRGQISAHKIKLDKA